MSPATKRLRLVDSAPSSLADEPAQLSDTELFKRFSPYVAGIGLRLLGRNTEVDDLVQEVFFAAFKQRDQLRDVHAARGWLVVVAVRTARRLLRRRRLRQFVGLEACAAFEPEGTELAPDDRALLSRLYQILDQVDVDCRLAWILRYIEGEKLEQVAERCGCSLATAKRRIAAVQTHLQGEIGRGW